MSTNIIGLNGSIKKKKLTLGRQKIEIKKIEDVNHRQVTFSKRRTGLFKKASELCVLTGAEVAAIVTSPGNRTFAFCSQTDPTALLKNCLSEGDGSPLAQDQMQNPEKVRELNEQYSNLLAALEEEEKRGTRIVEEKGEGGGFWWEEQMDGNMGVEELERYMFALEKLKRNVQVRADELMMSRARDMAANPLQIQPAFCSFNYDPNLDPHLFLMPNNHHHVYDTFPRGQPPPQ
ncbi:agamous-like MADS-box protein AGL61 [Impatiens glandulifera]|uniref:agamous-like MADS-box protein AGL61 n=1 Tax=Impatiens glandulifera TaxID=253017 RepID=UPI001FB18E58|nr:agamous-like MADS-box protein AGL61 [Impatiens glandulifera]